MELQHQLKLLKSLQSEKTKYLHLWRDAFDFTFPARGAQFHSSDGYLYSALQHDDQRRPNIYDNVATFSTMLLATHMKSGVTPQNSLWFNCGIEGVDVADLDTSSRRWLEQVSTTLHSLIHNSNYEQISLSMFQDLVICGQSGLYCTYEDDKLNYQYWPFWSYVSNDRVMFKLWYMDREEIATKLKYQMEQDKSEVTKEHKIYQSIYKDGQTYKSDWILQKEKKIIYSQTYTSNPVINIKWMELPSSNYCTGPINDVLPAIKSVNKLQKILLTNADMTIGGTYIAKRGTLNTNTIRLGPRQIIVTSDVNDLRPLQGSGDIRYAEALISILHQQIRQGLFADLLVPQDGPTKTATEVDKRSQLAYRILSPILSRIGQKISMFLIRRSVDVLEQNNRLPIRPEQIAQRDLSVQYQSPVARAARLQDLDQITTFQQAVFSTAEVYPESVDWINVDEMIKLIAEILGAPSVVINDDQQVQQKRQQRMEAQQQQQMMEAQQQPEQSEGQMI